MLAVLHGEMLELAKREEYLEIQKPTGAGKDICFTLTDAGVRKGATQLMGLLRKINSEYKKYLLIQIFLVPFQNSDFNFNRLNDI